MIDLHKINRIGGDRGQARTPAGFHGLPWERTLRDMDPHREDAPGATQFHGDGAAPGAPGVLNAVRGLDPSGARTGAYVDVYDSRHPADILYVTADMWAAFAAEIKAGKFDHLVPDELKPPAGPPPLPGRAP